jgi:hypothetical protein
MKKIGMRKRDRLFALPAAFIFQNELHVHRVGMPDRNCGLQPLEEDLIFAAEGIGSGFELAECLHLKLFYNGVSWWLPN